MSNLSSDTEATLLLCGHFQPQQQSNLKPLTPTEYNKLAEWLHKENKRPSDLVTSKLETVDQVSLGSIVDVKRLEGLVGRGTSMALALEAWEKVGLWIMGRSDPEYPRILRKRFGNKAPPLLFGVGNRKLLGNGGVCIVGSRNISAEGRVFAEEAARRTANSGVSVISGGARGVDQIAMQAALDADGTVVGVVADSLLKAAVTKQNRQTLNRGDLVLISPFGADTAFTPGIAMGRNRYLYALSELAVIVDSDTSGGTWSGAQENCRHHWVPAFVRAAEIVPEGNRELIGAGLTPLTFEQLKATEDVRSLLSSPPALAAPQEVISEQPPLIPDESLLPELPRGDYSSATIVSDEVPTAQTSIDFYELFVAKCEQELEKSDHLSEVEIVDKLALEKSQVKIWLTRAVDEGKLARLTGPVRYIKAVDVEEVAKQLINAVTGQVITEDKLIKTLNIPRALLKPIIDNAVNERKLTKLTGPIRYMEAVDVDKTMKRMVEAVTGQVLTEKQLVETLNIPRAALIPIIENAVKDRKLIKLTGPARYSKAVNEDEAIKQVVDAVTGQVITEKQLVEMLNIPQVLLKPIIGCAVELGLIKKKGNPVRYEAPSQKSLMV